MNLTQKEGYRFAMDNNLLPKDKGDFYKLYKSICRLEDLTGNEKIVFTCIISYTDRGMEFHMSNNTIAVEV